MLLLIHLSSRFAIQPSKHPPTHQRQRANTLPHRRSNTRIQRMQTRQLRRFRQMLRPLLPRPMHGKRRPARHRLLRLPRRGRRRPKISNSSNIGPRHMLLPPDRKLSLLPLGQGEPLRPHQTRRRQESRHRRDRVRWAGGTDE